jgi:hypothetical protein
MVCKPDFIKTSQYTAKLQSVKIFQQGGGGHLGKVRRTVGVGDFSDSALQN